ncbi:MAG: methyltransferase domain-containing protein [Planctomycetota bacterium]
MSNANPRATRWIERPAPAPEQMDAADVDPAALTKALQFIRRVNALLRYNAAVESALRSVGCGEGSTVLDVATGSADLPQRLRRTLGCHVLGLDLHAETLAIAAAWTDVPLVRGDALRLPLADASVDFVTANLFLHHLDNDTAVAVLRESARVARKGVVVADLLRNRRALAWITLFTACASPMVRHDARISVRQGWTMSEAETLADHAGLAGARVERCFGHRFVLAWRKT